jgi:deoxyribonuclease-4
MSTTRKKPGGAEQKRFGAHMSIAGGMHLAVERAVEAGCDCFQVFVKNQRQWKARPFTETEISEWKSARRAAGREPVIAHDTYLINLAAPDEKIRRASIEAFLIELLRCEQLEIGGLVAHPGAHLGQGEPWGLKRIAESLDEIHAAAPGVKALTLLEVTAGQGSSLGHRFVHLGEFIGRVRVPQRLGV